MKEEQFTNHNAVHSCLVQLYNMRIVAFSSKKVQCFFLYFHSSNHQKRQCSITLQRWFLQVFYSTKVIELSFFETNRVRLERTITISHCLSHKPLILEPFSIKSCLSLPERKITSAVTTMTMVEKYTQDYIQSILSDAQSIRDVTVDHIEELKHLQAGRLVLDKYQVSVEDFENWDAKDDQSGIEYDSRLQRVLVKSVDGASLYEYPNKCLYSWMEDLSSQLCISSRRGPYKNVGRTGQFAMTRCFFL